MSQAPDRNKNIVRLIGFAWNDCGYCKGERANLVQRQEQQTSSHAYSVLAEELQPALYETLICRGWRRSGTALYKPDNWNSCCPTLTIRLPVAKFVMTKSQRKVLRRMKRTLEGNAPSKQQQQQHSKHEAYSKQSFREKYVADSGIINKLQQWTRAALERHLPTASAHDIVPIFKFSTNPAKQNDNVVLYTPVCAAISGKSRGLIDRTSLASQLAQELSSKAQQEAIITRISHHEKSGQVLIHIKLPSETSDVSMDETMEEDEDFQEGDGDRLATWWSQHVSSTINSKPLTEPRHFTIETIPAHESVLDPDVHKLYLHYQHRVHDDPDPFQQQPQQQQQNSDYNGDWGKKAPDGWLARAHQMLQKEYAHLSSATQTAIAAAFGSFYEFLVENPFEATNEESSKKLGCYHQHYRINGVLVAVGVVDLLPTGLSSVYLFYDVDFARDLVPLGKFAILKEIEYAAQNNLPYYYLGYYIQDCQKMKYKAEYQPSEILCPKTLHWVDAKEAQDTLRRESPERHCCVLYKGADDDDDDEDHQNDEDFLLNQVRLSLGPNIIVPLSMLQPQGQQLVRPHLEGFVSQAGREIASQILLSFA